MSARVRPFDRRRGRLLPYYVYMTSVVSVCFPIAAIVLPARVGQGYSAGLVQLAFGLAGVHALVAAWIVLVDWRGSITQLRGIARVQFRKWGWCRWAYALLRYRDTGTWWRVSTLLSLVPGGLVYVGFALAIR